MNVFFVLEPLFVRDVLLRQGNALLYLWGAHGLGALAGAIAITRARNTAGHEARMVCAGVVLVGAGIVVYTAVGRYPVALVASAASGVGFALFFPPLLALIQRVIPEDQRGRVTSVFVALQETAGLASSLALLAFGGRRGRAAHPGGVGRRPRGDGRRWGCARSPACRRGGRR